MASQIPVGRSIYWATRDLVTQQQECLVTQWLERPTGIWDAMASIPVGDSEFFFVPRSRQMNISSLSFIYRA